jgi:hypothetical protein
MRKPDKPELAGTEESMPIFMIIGVLFFFAGVTAAAVEFCLCRRIVAATGGRSDGLLPIETWLNVCQLTKWRKLAAIADSDDERPELRRTARTALRLEAVFYVLCLSGMTLMTVGALV